MRIAVVGAGGVGGLLTGLLARAGAEVVLVARGAALAAVREGGLTVDTPDGAFTARPAAASDDPAALGPCDATLVAVKTWQVAPLAGSLAPLLSGGGIAVPLQNGVEAAGRLASSLPPAQVAGGLCFLYAWSEAPGRIRHAGAPPRVTMGSRPGAPLDVALAPLAAALGAAGIRTEVVADVEAAAWEKLLFIGPLGLLGAVSRAPAGPLRALPATRSLLEGLMAEVAAVARARGVAVASDVVARTLAKVDGVPAGATASMQRDLAAGRPSELRDQAGAVLRLAAEAGVPAPLHQALVAALLPLEAAARGEQPGFERC
jgi:2-dehydropantoate 2-reductase